MKAKVFGMMAAGMLVMALPTWGQTARPEKYFLADTAGRAPLDIPDRVTEGEFTVTVTGCLWAYSGPGGDVVIPETVAGIRVTEIGLTIGEGSTEEGYGVDGFDYDYTITSVTIPASVTTIGTAAFDECYVLHTVTFAEGGALTRIRALAFADCYALAGIVLPSGVKRVDMEAFYACTSLTNVILPEGLTYIGAGVFKDCSALTKLTIPRSVDTVGWAQFYGCTALNEIRILNPTPPAIVRDYTYIFNESQMFTGVPSSCVLIVPDGSKAAYQAADQWSAFANRIFTEPEYAAYWYDYWSNANYQTATAADFTIQNGVIMRYKGAGGNVWIPDSINGQPITGIDNRAFQGNNRSSLTAIRLPNGLKTLNTTRVIHRNDSSYTVDTLIDTVYIAEQTFQSCENLSAVIIPDSIRSIGNDAFAFCPNLRYVSFPRNLQTIGEYAFADCSALTQINLPDNIDSIANFAFYNCSALSTVTLGSGLRKLEEHAFYNCLSITTLNSRSLIPSALGMNVFGGYGSVGGSMPIANCVLYVPETSGMAYNAADVWRDFPTITADIPVGHDTVWMDTAYLHDTTEVHDTIHVDTTLLHDTIHLDTTRVHDTIHLDTTKVHDTIHLDTTSVHDTIHLDTIGVHDTIHVDTTLLHDTIHLDTTKVHDTIHLDTLEIHDTIHLDTLKVHDTIHLDTLEIHDTIHKDSIIYDDTIHKDSIAYTIIHKDSIIYDDTLHKDSVAYDTIIHKDSVAYDTIIHKDSIIYGTIIRKDSVVYNTIHRDTLVYDTFRYTVTLIDTTLIPDTVWQERIVVEQVEVEVHDTLTLTLTLYIVIDQATAAQTVVTDNALVMSGSNGLFLEGLTPSQPFAIYSVDGALVLRATASPSGTYLLPPLAPGTYLLCHAGKWLKFSHQSP